MSEHVELEIHKIGSGGDGVADGPDGAIYVPYTLPGEKVLCDISGSRGRLVEILQASGIRKSAVCPHFTKCGGCAFQHIDQAPYLDWKRERIVSSLANRGIEADVSEVFCVGEHARRRVVLSMSSLKRSGRASGNSEGAEVLLGFHREGHSDVIDMVSCPVAVDKIVKVVPRLRKFLEPVLRDAKNNAEVEGIRIHVLSASNGLDITIAGLKKKMPRDLMARLAKSAGTLGAVRVSVGLDPIYKSSDPIVVCGPARVVPQPGVFLQACQEAEEKMVALILAALPKRVKRVADLFCGLGAFTFPLSTRARVCAFDTDRQAIEALIEAKRHTKGIKQIDAKVRDLFQEPLSRKELEEFDLVVFDPPRTGARHQVENLAKSKVPVIVAVSCNPATFARDARILMDGGYSLQNVTPIDQFVYAAHVELVAVFRR